MKEYDLETLRNQVAMVLQKNVLFSGTIKENLRWGSESATDEELVHACKLAQADEFVSQFPDGYDTYIEQGGTNAVSYTHLDVYKRQCPGCSSGSTGWIPAAPAKSAAPAWACLS